MKIITILLLAVALGSCNFEKKETEQAKTDAPGPKKVTSINCYRYASQTDTILLKTIPIGNAVTGTLVYKLKEKDKNEGTIQGTMKGNMLLADYSFMSEGMQSTRQVAFKLEGNAFVEGYGDISIENDKVSFKNPDSLTFNTTMKLVEIDCQ